MALLVSHSQDLPRKSITGSPPLPASPAASLSLEPPFYLAKEVSPPPGPITHVCSALTSPALTVSEGRIRSRIQRAENSADRRDISGNTEARHVLIPTHPAADASPLMRNTANPDSVDQTLHQGLQPSALLSPQLVRESLASGAVISAQTSSSTPASSRHAVPSTHSVPPPFSARPRLTFIPSLAAARGFYFTGWNRSICGARAALALFPATRSHIIPTDQIFMFHPGLQRRSIT